MNSRMADYRSLEEERDRDRDQRVAERFVRDTEASKGAESIGTEEKGQRNEGEESTEDSVEIIAPFLQNKPQPLGSFEDPNIPEFVKQVVRSMGFKAPTTIQKYLALLGYDMIAIAKTGSGKTFSYMIPCIMKVANLKRQSAPNGGFNSRFIFCPLGLVLAPTRELAIQIHNSSMMLAHRSGTRIAVVYGGAKKDCQLGEMSQGVDVLIATPGRLIDFLQSGSINLAAVSFFVLDEADRMLDMGFYPQVREISDKMNTSRQTMFLSATWPKEVQKLSSEICKNNPVRLKIGHEDLTLNNSIVQKTEYVSEMNKKNRLLELMRYHNDSCSKFIVFMRTKKSCDKICRLLENEGYKAIAIHGDKHQNQRDYIINSFRNSVKNILVATDVASRGLGSSLFTKDIKDIKYVINYDFPQSIEDYVHRIGRTGRAGAYGMAFTFINENDVLCARDLLDVRLE